MPSECTDSCELRQYGGNLRPPSVQIVVNRGNMEAISCLVGDLRPLNVQIVVNQGNMEAINCLVGDLRPLNVQIVVNPGNMEVTISSCFPL